MSSRPINAFIRSLLSAATLLMTAATVTQVVLGQVARPVRTVCSIPSGELTPAALHAKHAVSFYASSFPSIDWRHRLLGDGNTTTRNYVSAWAIQGANTCDAMIGPGFSFLAIAMSPLMDVPWFDFGATSIELSDKSQHPAFSRVIPTDEVGGKAASSTMLALGWKYISVFCVDDGYGRSVAGGVSSDIASAGGRVEVRRCLSGTSTRAAVEGVLDAIVASGTRVVFVAMLPTQQTYKLFIEVALERRLDQQLIFFFAEAMCSLSDRTYAQLRGSLCATYTMNPAIIQPFMASYWRRDVAAIEAELRAMGLRDPLLANASDIYSQLAHDATYHVMAGMTQHLSSGSTTSIIDYVRAFVSVGASGEIRLDSNGDRITADAAVFNSQPDARGTGVEVDIGRVILGNFTFLANATRPPLYFLGQMSSTYPVDVLAAPEAAPAKSDTTLVIVLCVLAALLVIGVLGSIVIGWVTAPKSRDNRAAPKETGKPFAIVFTDIQSSTTLWANAPVETSEAIELHHQIVRKQIAKHKGYEVKTIGDAFMVAFIKPKDALSFALACQEALFGGNWGPNGGQLDRIYREGILEKYPDDHPKYVQREIYDELWNGIRVRIGVHFGSGDIKFDEVSLGYDYYGTVVNTAARVEAVGHGGQICFTGDFLEAFGGGTDSVENDLHCQVRDLGDVQLRGLNTMTRIYQCLPVSLSGRVFPELRLEVDVEDDDDDDADSAVAGSAGSSAISVMLGADGHDGQHGIEVMGYKHAKRFGLAGPSALSFAKRVGDYHALVSTILSTSKPPKRAGIAFHIGVKWRVPLSDEKQLLDKRKFDEVLVNVIAKSVRVMDAQTANDRGLRGMGRSGKAGDTSSGRSSARASPPPGKGLGIVPESPKSGKHGAATRSGTFQPQNAAQLTPQSSTANCGIPDQIEEVELASSPPTRATDRRRSADVDGANGAPHPPAGNGGLRVEDATPTPA